MVVERHVRGAGMADGCGGVHAGISVSHRHQILSYRKRPCFGLVRASKPRRNQALILVLPRFAMVNPLVTPLNAAHNEPATPGIRFPPTLIKEEFTPRPIPFYQFHHVYYEIRCVAVGSD